MMCVFLAFSLMSQRGIAEFGISLTIAVALDAFVLRTVLRPRHHAHVRRRQLAAPPLARPPAPPPRHRARAAGAGNAG